MHVCTVIGFDNYSHLKFMGSFLVSVDRNICIKIDIVKQLEFNLEAIRDVVCH
jgi:hypothetical protein